MLLFQPATCVLDCIALLQLYQGPRFPLFVSPQPCRRGVSASCRLARRCLVGSGRLPIPCVEAAGPLQEYDESHPYMRW